MIQAHAGPKHKVENFLHKGLICLVQLIPIVLKGIIKWLSANKKIQPPIVICCSDVLQITPGTNAKLVLDIFEPR